MDDKLVEAVAYGIFRHWLFPDLNQPVRKRYVFINCYGAAQPGPILPDD